MKENQGLLQVTDVFYSLRRIIRSTAMSKAFKIEIYKMMVEPTVVYGNDTWATTEMDMKRLGRWKREILRRIHGQEVKQGTQRVRINQKLRDLYKDLDTVADIRKKRYEWTGHVVGMNHRTVKKILESKLEGNRRKGRPRLRWLEDVEKNLCEMKLKR